MDKEQLSKAIGILDGYTSKQIVTPDRSSHPPLLVELVSYPDHVQQQWCIHVRRTFNQLC